MQEQLNSPIRYMFLSEGQPPVFLTCEHNSTILIPNKLYGSTEITTPNLTGRLNAIVDNAEHELSEIQNRIAGGLGLYSHTGKIAISNSLRYAEERLHDAEFIEWMVWFARMRYEEWGESEAANYAEMDRLTKLQYNGRAPF